MNAMLIINTNNTDNEWNEDLRDWREILEPNKILLIMIIEWTMHGIE